MSDLFHAAWEPLATAMKEFNPASDGSSSPALIVPNVLKVVDETFQEGTTPRLASGALIDEIGLRYLRRCEVALEEKGDELIEGRTLENCVTPIVNLIDAFGAKLFGAAEFVAVSTLHNPISFTNTKRIDSISLPAHRRTHHKQHTPNPQRRANPPPSLPLPPQRRTQMRTALARDVIRDDRPPRHPPVESFCPSSSRCARGWACWLFEARGGRAGRGCWAVSCGCAGWIWRCWTIVACQTDHGDP